MKTKEQILVECGVLQTTDIHESFNLRLSRDCYLATVRNILKAMDEYTKQFEKNCINLYSNSLIEFLTNKFPNINIELTPTIGFEEKSFLPYKYIIINSVTTNIKTYPEIWYVDSREGFSKFDKVISDIRIFMKNDEMMKEYHWDKGEPCSPSCLHHKNHPCENCLRINADREIYVYGVNLRNKLNKPTKKNYNEI